MMNMLEEPESWQKQYFVAWVGEADHEAALAPSNGWLGPIAETLKTHGHYAQVSLLCGGDVRKAEQYREWLLAQTTYPADKVEIWPLSLTDPDDIGELDRQVAARMGGRKLPYRSVVTCLLSSCSPSMAAIWTARAVLGYGERLVRTTDEGGLEAVTCRVQLLNECLPPWWRPGAVQRHATTPWRLPEESILAPETLPMNNFLHERKKRGVRPTGVNVHLLLIVDPDGREQVQSFAQVVHSRSAFARGPLVSFECRSVPRGNLRALLFGTSAEDGRSVSGAIAQAFGGTLVLRDLDALSEVDQRILLNTLELHADEFRLIGTLSRDPRRAMGPASLCEALFDRLAEGILVG
jgi:hypothetical protein